MREDFPLRAPDAGPSSDAFERLDAYVDGSLTPAQRAEFEAALSTGASLREAVEVQRAMDESLRRLYRPDVEGISATLPLRSRVQRPLWVRVGAIAAILVLGAVALLVNTRPAGPVISPFEGYTAEVRNGMQPYEVCTNNEEFVAYMRHEFGEPIGVEHVPGLMLIGWGVNQDVMSLETISLLARFADPAAGDSQQPATAIVVFMDKSPRDRRMPSPPVGLKMHRAKVGQVVMYEVSPLDRAVILPALTTR